MSHFFEILSFFWAFMLGALLAMWVQIDDINDMVERLTIKKTIILFLNKEWKSYGFSTTFGVAYASWHDEWVKFFVLTNIAPDKLLDTLGALPMIASFLLGLFIQLGGYRLGLGKLKKLFRNQINITNNKN